MDINLQLNMVLVAVHTGQVIELFGLILHYFLAQPGLPALCSSPQSHLPVSRISPETQVSLNLSIFTMKDSFEINNLKKKELEKG